MAKRRSRGSRRDTRAITNTPSVAPYRNQPMLWPDLRVFSPSPQPFKTVYSTPANIVVSPRKKRTYQHSLKKRLSKLRPAAFQPTSAIAFEEPRVAVVCVRRKIRKEVLHATGFAGKRGQRKPRYNEASEVNC